MSKGEKKIGRKGVENRCISDSESRVCRKPEGLPGQFKMRGVTGPVREIVMRVRKGLCALPRERGHAV